MQNFAYFQCVFLPLRTWRIVPYDLFEDQLDNILSLSSATNGQTQHWMMYVSLSNLWADFTTRCMQICIKQQCTTAQCQCVTETKNHNMVSCLQWQLRCLKRMMQCAQWPAEAELKSCLLNYGFFNHIHSQISPGCCKISCPWKQFKRNGIFLLKNNAHTYRKAVAADAGFLQGLRSSKLLHIQTVTTFATVFASAWFTFPTSYPPAARPVTNLYLSLLCLRPSTFTRLCLSSLRQLHMQSCTQITRYHTAKESVLTMAVKWGISMLRSSSRLSPASEAVPQCLWWPHCRFGHFQWLYGHASLTRTLICSVDTDLSLYQSGMSAWRTPDKVVQYRVW